MIKHIKNIVILILSCIICFSGCTCNPNPPVDNDDSTYSFNFVENGVCDYQIVVPDGELNNPRKDIKTASEELKSLIYKATGNSLSVIEDDFYTQGKFISLGKTKLVPETADEDLQSLEEDGVLCFNDKENIFLLGGSDTAVCYAVYEFLERYFGFDAISNGVEIIDENVQNLRIEEFCVVENPDIRQRHFDGTQSLVSTENSLMQYRYRMRSGLRGYTSASGLFTEENGRPTETYVIRNMNNTVDYIPYERCGKEHGDYWYATDLNGNVYKNASGEISEVCFTAHGNAEQYTAMVNEYAYWIKKIIVQRFTIAEYQKSGQLWWKNSTWDNVSIATEDNSVVCNCPSCKEKKALYGDCNSGLVIKFVKDVADSIYEWFDVDGAKYFIEGFKISFSAYQNYVDAPAVYDAQKKCYVAVCKDVELNDRVQVNLTLSSSSKYSSMLDINDSRNAEGKQTILKWFDLSNNITLWTYQSNFEEYLHFTDSFVFFSNDTFKFFSDLNVISWYNQSAYDCVSIPGYTGLKTYLNSKLMWDADSDIEFYINRYFSAMYGDSAVEMKTLFDKQRQMFRQAYSQYITNGDDWNGISYYDTRTNLSGYYYDDDLTELIEGYKSLLNSVTENSDVYYRIQAEAIVPYYTLLTNCKTRVSQGYSVENPSSNYSVMTDELLGYKQELKSMIDSHTEKYGRLYKSETGYKYFDDMFWSQLGYRYSKNGGRPFVLLIPRIDCTELGTNNSRVNNLTEQIAIGEHELDWVFGLHSSPYSFFDYTDIKFEVVSGSDCLEILPNDYVVAMGGKIPSSLISDIKDENGQNYTYLNPYTGIETAVERYDYGILKAKKSGQAVLRLTFVLDGTTYKSDILITVN